MAGPPDPDSTLPLASPRPTGGAPLSLDDDGKPEKRYTRREELGMGGMGEVRLCDDHRAGREVAMKVARAEALQERFLHEARIQAQLEHPSIVPVYDIGLDASGAPYFTMKRIRGVTLAEVVQGLRKGEEQAVALYTRRRLLTAFATVCMTVHYAHTRNVLHRDLKPSNIMLGEYGEIYVLDWGVARAEGAVPDAPMALKLAQRTEDTTPGDVVGTPGYIAPEQLRGGRVDARADVYALGAILFSILSLERLHARDRLAAMRSTLEPGDARPSTRTRGREVPPELDAICVRATALDPEDRYPSARALHDAVDRYLEGDRDLERRRELSAGHTASAEALATDASKEAAPRAEAALRARAMGEVNQALALDPDNAGARRVLMRLLTEPPRELPDEASDELGRIRHLQQQKIARAGAWLFLSGLLFVPLAGLTVGFRQLVFPAGVVLLALAAGGTLMRISLTPYERSTRGNAPVVFTMLCITWLSSVAGPLFAVPTLITANMIGFLMQPDRSRRKLIVAMACGAVLVPLLAEWVGLVPPSYVFDHGTMVVMNRVMDLTPGGVIGGFGIGGVLLTLAIGWFFMRFSDMLSTAERRLHLHAWHLRQLVPRG